MNAPEFRHAFERAGLGIAPYHLVGFHKDEGTCCAFCGTPIVYCFEIEGADGRKFVVGSDCVSQTGDAGLVLSIKRSPEVRKLRREQAAAKDRVVATELTKLLDNPPEALPQWLVLNLRNRLRWCGMAGRKRLLREARAALAKVQS